MNTKKGVRTKTRPFMCPCARSIVLGTRQCVMCESRDRERVAFSSGSVHDYRQRYILPLWPNIPSRFSRSFVTRFQKGEKDWTARRKRCWPVGADTHFQHRIHFLQYAALSLLLLLLFLSIVFTFFLAKRNRRISRRIRSCKIQHFPKKEREIFIKGIDRALNDVQKRRWAIDKYNMGNIFWEIRK